MIIEELELLYPDTMIPLAVHLLRIYCNTRPGQMLALTHSDFDFHRGGCWITRKGKKGKQDRQFIAMLPEEMELIGCYPKQLPKAHFFTHRGNPLTTNNLNKKWQLAVKSLKKKGLLPQSFNVSLYGGTRHTTISALNATPKEIRRSSKHLTTKAFDKYFKWPDEKDREVLRRIDLQRSLQPPIKGAGDHEET